MFCLYAKEPIDPADVDRWHRTALAKATGVFAYGPITRKIRFSPEFDDLPASQARN